MIVIIDNFDSFVHNLARYVRLCGVETMSVRNNEIGVDECLALNPTGIIISPGPKRPEDAGISRALIAAMSPKLPFLGVCLGHQCLVEVFGGETVRAAFPLHGEASFIRHDGGGLFKGIVSPTPAGRYHSLISKLPEEGPLIANAWSEEGEIMAIKHHANPWFGVQFHPESLLTSKGSAMIENFISYCDERN